MLSKKSFSSTISPLIKLLQTHFLSDTTFSPSAKDVEILQTFIKLTKNIIECPQECKYRTLKSNNVLLQRIIYQRNIGPMILKELGFVKKVHDFEEKYIFYSSAEYEDPLQTIEGDISQSRMKLLITGHSQLCACLATIKKRIQIFEEKADYKLKIKAEEKRRKQVMEQFAQDREILEEKRTKTQRLSMT